MARCQAAERYVFDLYGAERGLHNVIVTALCQDQKGFLWVGTENGLYRYDGHRFLRFSTAEGLPGDSITGLYESADGTLWVGTTKGLSWRTGIRFAASADERLRTIAFTQGVASDPAGHIYLATTNGLGHATLGRGAKDVRMALLPTPPGVKSPRVSSVWREPKGAIWFGCGTSICRSDGDQVQVWGESAGVPADGWQYLLKDATGNLWARSRIHLIELPAGAQQFRAVGPGDAGPLHFAYPSLALDGRGALLVPSDSGLSMLRGGAWTRVGSRQGMPGSIVTAAFRDREGSLWVGTSAGLARWAGYGESESFTELEGLSSGGNLALLGDRAGSIWAGTAAGLSHGAFSGGSWKWSAVPDPSLTWVTNLAQAKDGAIWFSTVEARVLRLDPRTGKVRRYGHFDGAPYGLLIDSPGNLWVIRTNALFRGSTSNPSDVFERVIPPGSTPTTVFTRAVEDIHGDLWFGSLSGLFRLSGGKWSHFQKQDGLAGKMIFSPTATPAGDLYVTYRDDTAVDRIRPEGDSVRVEHVDRSKGLAADNVYSIRADREGRLWAVTDHGAKLREGGTWIPFDRSDGLLGDDCNTFLASTDGSIWIGSDRGVTRFPSPKPRVPDRDPTVLFSEIRLGDRLTDASMAPVEPQPEPFTAKFTTLALAHAQRIQYRYRCLGFDDHWVETSRPEVSFDYLRPGHYRLEVQARRPDSPWHGAAALLALEVQPRWFESWWFEVLVAALLIGALWAAWKARVRYFAGARAKLQLEVDNRTRELRAVNEQLHDRIAEGERAARLKERLEEELLQAKKLESIGRLAGGVAHDFNNLLTVINGNCELILDRMPEYDPIRPSIVEVHGAGQRAADLTKQLLAFSRKQVARPTALDLNRVIGDSQQMLQRLVGEDVAVVVNRDASLGRIVADSGHIVQVLMNLAANARDAMPNGGTLTVTTANAILERPEFIGSEEMPAGVYVLLTVADTGTGMDEETKRHLFEPFYTTKDVGKGTGLGLATVYGIVRQSGGWIAAGSQPGQGTSFKIYLPRVEASSIPERPGVTAEKEAGGGEIVLVVEDQDAVRRLTKDILESFRYHVLEAADGDQACHVSQEYFGEVHLLLTDVVLPGMNGKELTERLKAARPNLKVLYMSGYTSDVIANRGVLDHGIAYIPKPFSPAELAAKVREVLTTG